MSERRSPSKTVWALALERSPLAFRTGMPFGEADGGGGDAGLTLPRPATLAGGLRAAWADATGHFNGRINDSMAHKSLRASLAVTGPWLAEMDDHGNVAPLVPVPADAAMHENPKTRQRHWYAMAPAAPIEKGASTGGCNLVPGVEPVHDALPVETAVDDASPYWTWQAMLAWLDVARPADAAVASAKGRDGLAMHVRQHQRRDVSRNVAEDGALFESPAVDGWPAAWYDPRVASFRTVLAARLSVNAALQHPADALNGVVCTLGADGHSVRWRALAAGDDRPSAQAPKWQGPSPDECPQSIAQKLTALKKGGRLRMVLATPGLFKAGARPGFLDEHLKGQLGTHGPEVKLVAAALKRWTSHAGVARFLNPAHAPNAGPSPVRGLRSLRRVVPAGAVYWLELLKDWPDGFDPATLWAVSVADDEQDRRDGWALALWGLAGEHKTT
jgi:CRISPR-associated protein Cmr3